MEAVFSSNLFDSFLILIHYYAKFWVTYSFCCLVVSGALGRAKSVKFSICDT